MIIHNAERRPDLGVGSLFTCLFKNMKSRTKMEMVEPTVVVSNSPILEKERPKKRKSVVSPAAENTPPSTPVQRRNHAGKKRKSLIEDDGNAN